MGLFFHSFRTSLPVVTYAVSKESAVLGLISSYDGFWEWLRGPVLGLGVLVPGRVSAIAAEARKSVVLLVEAEPVHCPHCG